MKDKRNILLITGLLVVLATLFFLVLEVNSLFIIAYVFAIIGILGLAMCSFLMLDRQDHYPWIASLPSQAKSYLILEIVISAIIISFDQLNVWSMPAPWLLISHFVIFAIFAIRILMLHGALDRIEERGKSVSEKKFFMYSLLIDIETIGRKTTQDALKEKIRVLADKVRYSDPMSVDALQGLEAQIVEKVTELKHATDDTANGLVAEIELLLSERNDKCKLMK